MTTNADWLRSMHLQWFGDADEDTPLKMQFKEPEAEEGDFVEVPLGTDLTKLGLKAEASPPADDDKDLPEDLRGLTRAQIVAKLKEQQQAEPLQAVAKGFEGLAAALNKPPAANDDEPAAVPEQKPGESMQDFFKRIGQDLFDDEKAATLFPEAVMRSIGPVLAQDRLVAMTQAQKLMRLDPETKPIYDSYGPEIEKEAKKLMAKHGPDARIYDVALETVKKRHGKELEDAKVSARVDTELKAKAAALGFELTAEGELKPKGKEQEAEGGAAAAPKRIGVVGSTSLGGGGSAVTTQKVRVTEELKALAKRRGISVERLVRSLSNG